MKTSFCLLIIFSLASALEAPYLISATALSDSSVELQWRNNDIATQGYLIQRADSNGVDFTTIDSVKSASTLSAVDSEGLEPLTLYTYRLFAYKDDTASGSSNTVKVRTVNAEIFQAPSLSAVWDILNPVAIQVSVSDNSNCESGYRIWRAEHGSADFDSIADLPSAEPSGRSAIKWYDSSISINKWYTFKVEIYRSDSSKFSQNAGCFTLQPESLKKTAKFSKVHELPLTLSGWSARAEDSIIFKESNSPAGKYSVINISDRRIPRFDGYVDSSALTAYPMESIIPVLAEFGVGKDCGFPNRKVLVKNDKVILQEGNSINLYRSEQNNSFIFLDSVILSSIIYNTYFFNDSLAVIHYLVSGGLYYSYSFFYWMGISDNVLIPVNLYKSNYDSYAHFDYRVDKYLGRSCRYWLHGFLDQTVLSTVDVVTDEPDFVGPSFIGEVSNGIVSCVYSLNFFSAIGNGFNTGCDIAPNIALTTNSPWMMPIGTGGPKRDATPTEIFAAYSYDLNSRKFAQDNNAILKLDTPYTIDNLQNIMLDTLSHTVYLVYNTALVTLGYTFDPVSTTRNALFQTNLSGLRVVRTPFSSSFAIVLPTDMAGADLFFYNISGKLVDKMLKPGSNIVMWQPKVKRSGCYIVAARSGNKCRVERFVLK